MRLGRTHGPGTSPDPRVLETFQEYRARSATVNPSTLRCERGTPGSARRDSPLAVAQAVSGAQLAASLVLSYKRSCGRSYDPSELLLVPNGSSWPELNFEGLTLRCRATPEDSSFCAAAPALDFMRWLTASNSSRHVVFPVARLATPANAVSASSRARCCQLVPQCLYQTAPARATPSARVFSFSFHPAFTLRVPCWRKDASPRRNRFREWPVVSALIDAMGETDHHRSQATGHSPPALPAIHRAQQHVFRVARPRRFP